MYELSTFYQYCRENKVGIIPMKAPAPGVTMKYKEDLCIFLDFQQIHTMRKMRGVSCHEVSHVATGALHKVDSPYETAERSEYRARRYAAEHFMTETDFRTAFSAGLTEIWELADYFDMPEEDVKKALSYWIEQKGINFNEEVSV